MKFQRKKVAAALGIGGIALLAAGTVVAQDIRVNVTGSNIKRVDTETAAPIETITREDIAATGLQTISEVVRQITANNNGSISSSFTNGFSAGGSGVSLRGLGPNNTLVLLNGRRLVNYGLADDGHASYPDLQQVPFEAVERIEVLKDGASAIYGSDAVAGVVNIILRQQFTGVTVTGTAGTTHEGDGNQYKGAITMGAGDLTRDRYNVFVTIDAQKQDAMPILGRKKYIGTSDLRFMGLDDYRFGDNHISANSQFGNVRAVAAANPAGAQGPLTALPGACAPEFQSGQFCLWEPKNYVDIQPEVERFNVFGRGSFNFTDTIQGYAELSYFQVKTENRTTPSGFRGTTFAPDTLSIVNNNNTHLPVGHPDNPFSATNQVARIFIADGLGIGARGRILETDTQRYLAGVKGTNWSWDWDVAALHIRSETDNTWKGFPNRFNLVEALNGRGGFGYYRIGANAHLNNPGIYNFVAPDSNYTIKSENTIFDAKASRDLMKLDGGQLGLAVGYQHLREEVNNPGYPGAGVATLIGLGTSAALGSRNVNAFFAELYAPILRNLEVTGAIRYDDYSDFGGTTNPKVGVKWTVLPQLVLRGTYATAFRAPGLYETSTANATAGFTTAIDPIRCPVTGALLDCGSGTVLSINTGNPFIKPETSDTYTVGVIWEPVPGISGSLDYWSIETKDQITIGNVQAVANNPSAFPAAIIGRDTNNLPGIPNSGTLLYVQTPFQNANLVKTNGIDLDIVWRQSLRNYGTLTTEFQWTHILEYVQTLGNGQSFDYVGTLGNYDISSAGGTPQDRGNLIIGWTRGPWNVTGTVRYVSDYQGIQFKGDDSGCLSAQFVSADCHVSSFTTLDLAAAYKGFKNWEIFGSVINVFNRIAPFDPATSYGPSSGNNNYNYNYALSGATGTQFNLGARFTFK